jgi:hypothetical protein
MKEYELFVVLASILAIELWRARTAPWTRLRRAWLLTLAMSLGAVGVYLGCVRVYIRNWDYLNGYYHAGRLVLQRATERFYYRDPPNRAGGFVNLPIVSLVYVPLALLSPTASVVVNGALGVASTALTVWLLVRGTSPRSGTLVAILFLASGPLWYSVTMGNVSHFLLLPTYAVFVLSTQRRDVWLGILLAVLVVLKPYLVILVAYFTFRRRFRVTAACVLAWAAIFGASVALFGFALNAEWWRFLGHLSTGPLTGYNNQSLSAFLARLLQTPDLTSDAPQVMTWPFRVAKAALMGSVLGALGWVFWRVKPPQSRQEEWLEIAVVLSVGTVIAPISWTYYYSLLLIPLALCVRGEIPLPRVGYWPIVLAAALITPPAQMAFLSGIRELLYERVLISHYFVGGMVLLWVLLFARWFLDRQRTPETRPEVPATNRLA